MWLDVFTFLCNKLNFIVFFSHERKISQILESLARKWNTLERNEFATVATWLKQGESITNNSPAVPGPLQFELTKFHCISTPLYTYPYIHPSLYVPIYPPLSLLIRYIHPSIYVPSISTHLYMNPVYPLLYIRTLYIHPCISTPVYTNPVYRLPYPTHPLVP